uniref:Uncharacterized protein n=1 Tax=Romanomermis culicivorax TaxID=13658 RepID=A0A915IX49_ROMCU
MRAKEFATATKTFGPQMKNDVVENAWMVFMDLLSKNLSFLMDIVSRLRAAVSEGERPLELHSIRIPSSVPSINDGKIVKRMDAMTKVAKRPTNIP